MQFNIMLIRQHNVVLELSWLEDINLKISFWCRIIDFLIRKLIHMSKEMQGSELEICTILTDDLKKKIWENSEQVKILWTRQTNLISIISINSILKEYQDFAELFTKKILEETLLIYQS